MISVTDEVSFAVLTLQTFIPELNAFIAWVIPVQKRQEEIKKKKNVRTSFWMWNFTISLLYLIDICQHRFCVF